MLPSEEGMENGGHLVEEEAEGFGDGEILEPGYLELVKVDDVGLEGGGGEEAEKESVEAEK